MSGRRRSLIIGAGTLAFFATVLFAVIPHHIRVPQNLANIALSPAFWPTTVAIMGTCLGALILARGLLGMQEAEPDDDPGAPHAFAAELRGLVAIAVMFAYVASIPVLGIVVASALVIPGLAVLYGERRFMRLAAAGIILPTALYGFFTIVVRIPLPMGIFERFL